MKKQLFTEVPEDYVKNIKSERVKEQWRKQRRRKSEQYVLKKRGFWQILFGVE